MITLIAAVARNGAIGYDNKLLYWLPNDLKRFKALTTGHTIIMGRRTFESLPNGALPNRRNIVLSRNPSFAPPGTTVFPSLPSALHSLLPSAPSSPEIFIIGGASVYAEALPLADRLCLTLVDDTPALADAFFPAISSDDWRIASQECHAADDRHLFPYTFIDYVRA